MLPFFGHLGVILACTLTAGPEQRPECRASDSFPECAGTDPLVPPRGALVALAAPIFVVVALGMPTVLVAYREQLRGIGALIKFLVLALGAIRACDAFRGSPTVQYVVALHCGVYMLLTFDPKDQHLSAWFWAYRYVAAANLCVGACYAGAPVSVVMWHAGPREGLNCAFMAHLFGVLVPAMLRLGVELVSFVAGALLGVEA